jgi:hypothetical protein
MTIVVTLKISYSACFTSAAFILLIFATYVACINALGFSSLPLKQAFTIILRSCYLEGFF